MSSKFAAIRDALSRIDPASSHETTRPPEVSEIYAPSGHEAALDPDRPLVIGGRGMGKSFWAATLAGEESRAYVSKIYPGLELENARIRLGFAPGDTIENGPISTEILDDLLTTQEHSIDVIWRTVILRSAASATGIRVPKTWRDLCRWAADDPERLQLTLRKADGELTNKKTVLVIVFDGLDRLAPSWTEIQTRTRALLRMSLAMRGYRSIKPKIFIRPDQAADNSLTNFPDASKLLDARVDLVWERRDLYGLAFSRLLQDNRSASTMHNLVSQVRTLRSDSIETLPSWLKDNEEEQQKLFTLIAGPYMGVDHRRGKTYSWLHSHLGDARGRVSPRSFLIALSSAAKHRPSPEGKALDPAGIRVGIQAASETRVLQLREEYAWISIALTPLADLRVPCGEEEFVNRWRDDSTVTKIRSTSRRERYLLPIELDGIKGEGLAELLEALLRIGVAERRPDTRINMPDIYRVAAKLLRKGGVPPRRG